MPFKIGEMFWKIEADTKDFDKGAKGTETKAKGLGKTFTTLGKTIAAGFAVAAVAGIASVSKELILAASEAEETRNKFNVVFGEVSDAAEAAGQRIKEEFKISDKDTEKFLSQVGDITTGLGATADEALDAAEQITALGLDIDSFANLSGGAEQAVSALTSLFTGEREAAKALGIVINDTNLKQYAEDTGKVFDELTQLEKGFLSLELATSQSQLAIGDFARSQDSFANQQRIAKAAVEDLSVELGNNLLPIATEITSIFGKATTAFKDYVKELNNYNRESEAAESLTGAVEDQIAGLIEKNRLLRQSLSDSLLDWQGQGFSDEQIELNKQFYSEQIQENQQLIDGLRLQEKVNRALADQASAEAKAQAAAALEAQRVFEEQQAYIAWIESEYAGTQQGKIEAIQREIDLIEEQKNGYGGLAEEQEVLLASLRAELEGYADVQENVAEREAELFHDKIGRDEDYLASYTQTIGEEIAIANQLEAFREEQAATELALLQARGAAYSNFFGGLATLVQAFGDGGRDALIFEKALSSSSAAINSYLAFTQVLADPSFIGRPFTRAIAAGAVLATGLAQQAKILATPIPAFETGGIVPGTSYTGDNQLAAVNSAEMILNQGQQKELFDIANGGGVGGGATFVLQLPNGREFGRWTVDTINSGQAGVIKARVVK